MRGTGRRVDPYPWGVPPRPSWQPHPVLVRSWLGEGLMKLVRRREWTSRVSVHVPLHQSSRCGPNKTDPEDGHPKFWGLTLVVIRRNLLLSNRFVCELWMVNVGILFVCTRVDGKVVYPPKCRRRVPGHWNRHPVSCVWPFGVFLACRCVTTMRPAD